MIEIGPTSSADFYVEGIAPQTIGRFRLLGKGLFPELSGFSPFPVVFGETSGVLGVIAEANLPAFEQGLPPGLIERNLRERCKTEFLPNQTDTSYTLNRWPTFSEFARDFFHHQLNPDDLRKIQDNLLVVTNRERLEIPEEVFTVTSSLAFREPSENGAFVVPYQVIADDNHRETLLRTRNIAAYLTASLVDRGFADFAVWGGKLDLGFFKKLSQMLLTPKNIDEMRREVQRLSEIYGEINSEISLEKLNSLKKEAREVYSSSFGFAAFWLEQLIRNMEDKERASDLSWFFDSMSFLTFPKLERVLAECPDEEKFPFPVAVGFKPSRPTLAFVHRRDPRELVANFKGIGFDDITRIVVFDEDLERAEQLLRKWGLENRMEGFESFCKNNPGLVIDKCLQRYQQRSGSSDIDELARGTVETVGDLVKKGELVPLVCQKWPVRIGNLRIGGWRGVYDPYGLYW